MMIGRMEKRGMHAFKVELDEQAEGVAAVAVTARGVESVAVGRDQLPSLLLGKIRDAEANASVSLPALVEPRGVIDHGGRGGGAGGPSLLIARQGHDVGAAEEHEAPGGYLLVVISGQGQGKFRRHGQVPAEPVGAEAIGVNAGPAVDDGDEALGGCRLVVNEQRSPPQQMDVGFEPAVAGEAVIGWGKAMAALIPDRGFQGQVGDLQLQRH